MADRGSCRAAINSFGDDGGFKFVIFKSVLRRGQQRRAKIFRDIDQGPTLRVDKLKIFMKIICLYHGVNVAWGSRVENVF